MIQPFPAGLPHRGHRDRRRNHPCAFRWLWASRRHAARLCRHRRHVGALGGGACERPHGHRPRLARHGPLVPPGRRLRQENPSRRRRAACSTASSIEKADLVTHDIGNMVGYAFAAQYPERVTRWVAMDAPLPGIGTWDEIREEPPALAFQFLRPRRRASGRRPRAHLSRPLLERIVGQSGIDRRSDPPALRQALRVARRHAFGASSSSRPFIRMRSTTRPWRQRASSP